MRTLKMLLREFWLPFALASGWTVYVLITDPFPTDFKSLIKTFGPAFFFVSWATGQFIRVRKQSHVESNLQAIQTRLEGLLSRLEARTTEIVAHITGGNSFCYVRLFNISGQTNMTQLIVINGGAHTVFDAQVRVTDLECFEKSVASKGVIPLMSCNSSFPVPSMITANHAAGPIGTLSLADGAVRRFNIFWSARNGDWVQLLRLVKVDGNWRSAIRVFRGEEVLFEEIQPEVPREVLGSDWRDIPQSLEQNVSKAS
jgi:hypothetical protein